MAPVRLSLLALILIVAGCSRDPATLGKVTGDPAAVSGLPRHHARDRLLVESCCTLQLGSDTRAIQLQGVDSAVYDVSGPGYVLHIAFGPYDAGTPQPGYQPAGRRLIDGVTLAAFRWADRQRKPPEGQVLWLAQVGGGRINAVNHTPWGLRVMGDCDTPAGCRASAELVNTIRF